ncbi:MAG: IS1182 family transposase [Acidobacteria bacterium]|nr:IS1182 family transposase [Acidobacteriota bacterium]
MPTTFRPCAPDQSLLFPPSPRDWLPEGHLAFFIADTVAALDLQPFYAAYEGDGRRNQPFDPQMMVTVLLYAYATGTFSSRRIARKLEEDVAYRVLAAGNFPAHRTIAEFRQQYLAAFEALFVQVVRIAREAGVVKLGALAVDGSKVKANASKHKAMSYGRMRDEEARLREQIAALTAQAEASDAAEDAALGPDVRGDELPAELHRRETRLATIAAAKARLEARQADEDRQKGRTPDDGRKGRGHKPFARDFGMPPDDAQDNFTDPESRIMKTSAGYDQCYNGQMAVDEASQMIVATGLTNCAADNAELLPLIEQTHATLGEHPTEVLADAGYRGDANFQALEACQITAYISLGREGTPATTPNPAHEATQRMAARLASDRGRARYRRRKAIVEPVIGWIKEVLGFRRFSLRGEAKARGEWNVVCLAVNLKRFHRISMA